MQSIVLRRPFQQRLSVVVNFTNSPSYNTSLGPIHLILYLLTDSWVLISSLLFRNTIDLSTTLYFRPFNCSKLSSSEGDSSANSEL